MERNHEGAGIGSLLIQDQVRKNNSIGKTVGGEGFNELDTEEVNNFIG